MALESAEALLRDGADASRYDVFIEQHSRCYSFEHDVYEQLFNTIISEVQKPQWVESHNSDWTGVLRVVQCLRLLTRNTVFLNRVIDECPTRRLLDALLHDIRATKSPVHGACVCEVLAIVNRIACADLGSLARLNFIQPLVQASTIIIYPMIVRCALETLAGASSDPDVLATVADSTNYPALLQVATRSSGHQHLALNLLADLCFYPPARKRFRQLCPFAGQTLLFWAQGAKSPSRGANDEKSEQLSARILHCLRIFEALAQDTTTYPKAVQDMADIGILKPMIGLLDFPDDAVKVQMLKTLSHMALQDDACAMALTKNHLPELFREIRSTQDVARHTVRLLRFLFAVERNRQAFKRVFPTSILAPFVDIGHYVWDLNAYEPFVAAIQALDEPLSDIPANEETPLFLGKYEVVDSLGEGAYGKVYLGKNEDGTEVALKEANLIREGAVPDLSQEVALLQSVDHPSIIKFHDSFIIEQKLVIVMEYCPGISLQMFLENGVAKKMWGPGSCSLSVPEPTCWDIFLQLALALRYLHVEKNITHRDLSANNVLLMPQTMSVKLADFGLAKQSAEHMLSVVGTILYLCPEIVLHQPYTHKADIWSLGCLLYKMAVMEDPFSGSNPFVVARRIVECDMRVTTRSLIKHILRCDEK
eukprot:GEMP01015664.1.p1 GENE.GEMP01015664.1~~GEMP01015664.1.p1  ORF type:complete len:650 (+),score=142.59 GEMP01015664.1:60-2009(+)